MKWNRICALCFSPTGNTDKTVSVIAETLAEKLALPWEKIGFTKPGEREQEKHFTETDIVVVGAPTYAGKLPNKILPDFQEKLAGGGAACVAVVTFGNRSYDNALAELCAVLEADGFHPAAAGAFVGRHAFTDALATGRPDWDDRKAMAAFATQIADKLRSVDSIPPLTGVPGDPAAPYYRPLGRDGEGVSFLKAKPQTDLSRCSRCGVCIRSCPVGAIDPADPSNVVGTCIKCQACVRKCTRHAKSFDDPAFLSHVAMLEQSCGESGKNESFL